jgi:hypothetical protein
MPLGEMAPLFTALSLNSLLLVASSTLARHLGKLKPPAKSGFET